MNNTGFSDPDDRHVSTSSSNRIILLGASNLTLSLRLIIQLMQQRTGGASEILVASGHGRAYGMPSQMLFRGLPGIIDCDLWQQLISMRQCPTYALLTDIGNDILYGATPEQILHAVEWCILNLQELSSAQIVVTNLPMASIERLSETRYIFFRNIFYPFCCQDKAETVYRARMVHAGLVSMSSRLRFSLYEPGPDWFGPDGIHINYWQRKVFYRDVVRRFLISGDQHETKGTALTWKKRPCYACKKIFGHTLRCRQPSGQLYDETMIFKY